ncbi:MAG TPA: hypothetical protein VHL80_03490 [Polyangia bacterium]|nr:hypothetical protein [Polyangia bacterium]
MRRLAPTVPVVLALLFGVRPTAAAGASLSSPGNRALEARPGTRLTLTVGDDVRIVEVSREGIVGPNVTLRRFPGHLRGQIRGVGVDFALAPPRITGQIGDQPISLDLLPPAPGGRMRVVGRFGDRSVGLAIGVNGIEGELGPCRYGLLLDQGDYTGKVECGAGPQAVRLSIPAAFVARDDAELAALLVALLAA